MTSVKRFCLPVFMDVKDDECRLLSTVSTHSFLTTTALLFVVTWVPEIELKSLIHLTKSHLVTIHSLYATGLPLLLQLLWLVALAMMPVIIYVKQYKFCFVWYNYLLQMFQKKYWLSSVCRSNEFPVHSALSFSLIQQVFVVGEFHTVVHSTCFGKIVLSSDIVPTNH